MENYAASSPLISLPLDRFLAMLASDSPAPGGGAAAALAGATGAALAVMVAGLTVGRKRYATIEGQVQTWLAQARDLEERLATLVDADAEAYTHVSEAYRLPQDTEEQQEVRARAIQDAIQVATDIPLDVAEACADLLEVLAGLAAHGNRNAAADAAVGALLAHAGLQGAVRNVRTNLKSLNAAAQAPRIAERASRLLASGEQALAATLAATEQRGG